jgi:hypothetical protein
MGMTRIWSTSATLTHIQSNKTIDSFPLVQWSAANTTSTSTNSPNSTTTSSSVHQVWTIPTNLPNGNYSLAIGGK